MAAFNNATPPQSRPDASTIARALTRRAEEVATTLLGKPSAMSTREYRWGRRGSISLCRVGSKRGLWNDFEACEGGDLLDLVARQRRVSLSEALAIATREFLGDLLPATVGTAPPGLAKVDDVNARTAASKRLWREARPILGTLAEVYFAEIRKLGIHHLSLSHVLRWHGGARAIVALMTDPLSGEAVGVHRTFLDADGAKIERKMLGRQGVIRLSLDDGVTTSLGITEGVEDGLAVLLSGWSPVWVATSAGALAKFPMPTGIECLTIFADADTAGLRSAEVCRDRWRQAGCEAVIAAPGRLA